MSGYLQRMVANVSRREHTTHPLVGGLFVKPAEQGVIEESATQSVPAGPQRADPISAAMNVTRDAETHPSMETAENVERVLTVSEPPLMAAKSGLDHAEVPEADKRHRGATQAETETMPQAVFSPAARAQRRVEPPIEAAELTGPFKAPLLMTEQEPPAPTVQKNERAGPMQQPATSRPAEQPSGAPQVRGREDIQIHIGRVEVIAVPPAAPRTAPAAARKTESLADYLRRRDRRVR
jgi:hypothetical protein